MLTTPKAARQQSLWQATHRHQRQQTPPASASGERPSHANASNRPLRPPAATRHEKGGKRQCFAHDSNRLPQTTPVNAAAQPTQTASSCHSQWQAPLFRRRSHPSATSAGGESLPPGKISSHRSQASRSDATAPPSPAVTCRYHQRNAQAPSQKQRPSDAKPSGKRHPHAELRSSAKRTSSCPTTKRTSSTSCLQSPENTRRQRRRRALSTSQAATARHDR